jgi:23S rRNA (pseudouridine1915-N3)-methyltransferase
MLNIEIVYLGSLDKNWQALRGYYEKILRPYLVIKFKALKAESFSNKHKKSAIKKESARIDEYLRKKNYSNLYLLSETGRSFNSIELADFFHSHDGRCLTLVLGGALGFSEELKNKYSLISLSPLTFPHQMSQIILLEQIYRSITILKQKNYHY